MANRSVEDLVARLQHEREHADRAYNDALTALGRAIESAPNPAAATDRPDVGPRKFAALRRFLRRLIGAAPNDTAAALLDAVRAQGEARARFESQLLHYVRTIAPFVDANDRASGGVDLAGQVSLAHERLAALRREVERLNSEGHTETADRFAPRQPSASLETALDDAEYLGFENRFRGSEPAISARQQDYVSLFAACSDVLDVGCGRGELLDLFSQHGIGARGIDMNGAMVARCRDRGLDVEQADAIGYLERQADNSLGGLTALQVVEHLQPRDLLRFVRLAYDKLKPGAPMVLETINAACWTTFFDAYIRDLTHVRPLHPLTLEHFVRACGFAAVDVQFREPVDENDRLDRVSVDAVADPVLARVVAAVNAHADKLNRRLFSYRDFAVIARR